MTAKHRTVKDLPRHNFKAHRLHKHKKNDPNAVCGQEVMLATVEKDGFELIAQCGRPLKEH